MSIASGSLTKTFKLNESDEHDRAAERTADENKKEHVPAIKNDAGSEDSHQMKNEWKTQTISALERGRKADDAEYEGMMSGAAERGSHLQTGSQPLFTLLPEDARAEPVVRLTTAISSGLATTTTTTTTATTATTATTTGIAPVTTTTTASPQKFLNQMQAPGKDDPAGHERHTECRIDFSSVSSSESLDLLKDFLAHPEQTKLTISYQSEAGMSNLRDCLFSCATGKGAGASEKEIVVEIGMPLHYKVVDLFAYLLNSLERTNLIDGIILKGDDVLRTYPRIKYLLERTPAIRTLQISDANSDTVCGTFKLWMEHEYAPTVKTTPGLKISRLCFAGLKISDAAVFGSILRTMVAKMPNIKEVDFSQTQLSVEQREVLRFQLEPLGRPDLLKF